MNQADVQQHLVTPSQFLRRGLKLVNVPGDVQDRRCRSKNCKTFKSHFGLHPNHCATLWKDLLATDVVEAQVGVDDIDLKGFFMALHSLRVCNTDECNAAKFGNPDINAMAATTWWWMQRFAALRVVKIKWPTDEEWGDDAFILSVDGTHMMLNEPRAMHMTALQVTRLNGRDSMPSGRTDVPSTIQMHSCLD